MRLEDKLTQIEALAAEKVSLEQRMEGCGAAMNEIHDRLILEHQADYPFESVLSAAVWELLRGNDEFKALLQERRSCEVRRVELEVLLDRARWELFSDLIERAAVILPLKDCLSDTLLDVRSGH